MIEPRVSIQIETGEPDEGVVAPSRRFAGWVESPAARRLSSRRLGWALLVAASIVVATWSGGGWMARSAGHWVAARPDYQFPFGRIALIPEPPPWIRPKAAGLLDLVRAEAKHGDTLPLLSLDLEALRTDFRRSPWVEDVTRVERSPGRLAVHLAYRRPVAVVEYKTETGKPGPTELIDKDGVVLPSRDEDVDWVQKKPGDNRVRGLVDPLIEIVQVKGPAVGGPGLQWKSAGSGGLDGPDPQVLAAARLADFLVGRDKKTPAGRPAPRFARIVPDRNRAEKFLLRDGERNWVYWGEAPGAEPPGGPSASDKWAMLVDWIDHNGPLAIPIEAKTTDYYEIAPSGVRRGPQAR